MSRLNQFLKLAVVVLLIDQSVAVVNSVDEVTDSPTLASVVDVPGCTSLLIHSQWLLGVAHCIDRWSDRTDPNDRDVTIPAGSRPNATFRDAGRTTVRVPIDRVVRIDGASTLTNTIVLYHLSSPGPLWSIPVRLYRGSGPYEGDTLELFGRGGNGVKTGGTVEFIKKEWRDIDKGWVLRLKADPSRIEGGDSGGPIIITRGDVKYVIGVNWNTGGASGGSGLAAFDIDSGHWNPVGRLIERFIYPASRINNGVYEVYAKHSGKSLDVTESSRENGAPVIQFTPYHTTNQRFRFTRRHGDYYEIQALHSGKCLDVPRSTMSSVQITQYTCNRTTNQLWRLTIRSWDYVIEAMHSAKCLDVQGSSQADSAPVLQHKCYRTTNQRWRLKRVVGG